MIPPRITCSENHNARELRSADGWAQVARSKGAHAVRRWKKQVGMDVADQSLVSCIKCSQHPAVSEWMLDVS